MQKISIMCENKECANYNKEINAVLVGNLSELEIEMWYLAYGHGSEDPADICPKCGILGVAQDVDKVPAGDAYENIVKPYIQHRIKLLNLKGFPVKEASHRGAFMVLENTTLATVSQLPRLLMSLRKKDGIDFKITTVSVVKDNLVMTTAAISYEDLMK